MTAKRYSMRNMQPRDMAKIIELHEAQNERDGTHYPLPRMFGEKGQFDHDIALALAVERDSVVTQGVYFQRGSIVEMCFAGCDARSSLYVRNETEAVKYTLRSLGYKGVRSDIPLVRVAELEKSLLATGFKRTDGEFASFFLDLEGHQ